MSFHLRSRLATSFAALLALCVSAAAFAQPAGAELYAANCASCHQANGQGLPGAFPPLAGHVADIYATEGGRDHLINVLLFGMQGPITVEGQDFNGVMPGWFRLSDEEISALLDHIMTAWGDAENLDGEYEAISAEEIGQARGAALSPQLVHQRRPAIPTGADESDEAANLELATFTQAQVDRIVPTYERLCAECHGDSLDGGLIGGPPLRGPYFDGRWGGQPVSALYGYTKARMPQNRPDSLSPQQYADLVALMLSVNGHEAGEEELPADIETLENLGIRDN